MAAELNAKKCIDVLLQHGADIEAKIEFGGDTPLIMAVGYGNVEITQLLLCKGARLRYEWEPSDAKETESKLQKDYRLLASEAQQKMASLIPFPLEDQTEEMVRMMLDVSLRKREAYALENCHDLPTLQLLVDEYGCEVNHHDGGGYWPLKSFAEAGDAAAVKFLLQHGADPNFTSTGDTALHAAVIANSPTCVKLLLDAGANPNQQDVDGCVAMYRVSSDDVLDLLLEYGADPNITDQCGLKPSHWIEEPKLKKRLIALEGK
jgi:ankyrin repeat protein